jgi:hypothetical protein
MEPFSELLATDERQALEFFVVGLKDVSESGVDERELLYTASVLAHYAQVSTQAGHDLPAPSSLSVVFEQFVLDTSLRQDSTMLETAGAQCLLLAGFFEAQMRRRHNIRWFSQLGSGFFRQAARLARQPKRAQLLDRFGQHFEPWRVRCSRLSDDLRDQYYVLVRPSPPDDDF